MGIMPRSSHHRYLAWLRRLRFPRRRRWARRPLAGGLPPARSA
jgi:hypothetical protein